MRTRLLARGLAPAAALTASLFAEGTASAAVSATLAAATVRTALGTAVSRTVAALAEGGLQALCISKMKAATVILLVASVLTGAGLWACRGLAAPNAAAPAEPPAAKTEDKLRTARPKQQEAKTVEVQGRVLDPDGKPKAEAKLLLLGGDKLRQLGTTAADGRFRIALPKETKEGVLIAQAEGFGIDFMDLPKGDLKKPIEFRLVKDRPIRGRVVNTEGKPVAGVRVEAIDLNIYPNNSLNQFLAYWKNRQVNDNPLFGMYQLEKRPALCFPRKRMPKADSS